MQSPVPVMTVCLWDLRRFRSGRLTFPLAVALLIAFAVLFTVKHTWDRPIIDGGAAGTVTVVGTSALGLTYDLCLVLLPFFGLLLPFVATEGVARDYPQRLHELMMTTPIARSAYIWGRYLAALTVSIGLALLLLVATAGTALTLHAMHPDYPMPDLGALLGVWVIALIPATVLLSGVSFTLGTMFPRYASLLKLAVIVGWFMLFFLSDVLDRGKTWFTYWNPLSYGLMRVNLERYLARYQHALASSQDGMPHTVVALTLQQQRPDLWPWVLPHLALVGLALTLVAVAAARFGRFRSLLGNYDRGTR